MRKNRGLVIAVCDVGLRDVGLLCNAIERVTRSQIRSMS